MADNFWTPFAPCPDIDGRLLVRQTFQGPVVAREEGAIPMGGLALHGAELLLPKEHKLSTNSSRGLSLKASKLPFDRPAVLAGDSFTSDWVRAVCRCGHRRERRQTFATRSTRRCDYHAEYSDGLLNL